MHKTGTEYTMQGHMTETEQVMGTVLDLLFMNRTQGTVHMVRGSSPNGPDLRARILLP